MHRHLGICLDKHGYVCSGMGKLEKAELGTCECSIHPLIHLPDTQGAVTYMLLVEVFVIRIKIFDQRKLCLITCMILSLGLMVPCSIPRLLISKFQKTKGQLYFLVSLMLAVPKSLIRYGLLNSKLILVAISSCGNT